MDTDALATISPAEVPVAWMSRSTKNPVYDVRPNKELEQQAKYELLLNGEAGTGHGQSEPDTYWIWCGRMTHSWGGEYPNIAYDNGNKAGTSKIITKVMIHIFSAMVAKSVNIPSACS